MKSNHNHNKHATTRTEENNRKTTKSNAGVRTNKQPKQTQETAKHNHHKKIRVLIRTQVPHHYESVMAVIFTQDKQTKPLYYP
jgi:hypothetical protein